MQISIFRKLLSYILVLYCYFLSLKGATLGLDIYDNNPLAKMSLIGQCTDVTLLPISFIVENGQTREWQYTKISIEYKYLGKALVESEIKDCLHLVRKI